MDFYTLILFAEVATLAVVLLLTALLFHISGLAFSRREGSGQPKESKQEPEDKKLLIPSLVLRKAHDYLLEHGEEGKEWQVVLGCQDIGEDKIITDAYKVKCIDSSPVSAEPDYGDVARRQGFYEAFDARLVALVHNHPWNGKSVSPSAIDWKTQREWENLCKGKFIGIVFTNNGVFRIFYTKNCTLKPVVIGGGVEEKGGDLYALKN